MSLLNTNTRYLHEHIVVLAKELVQTLPKPLEICYLVNSGSEANDLAQRLAWAHTKAVDTICLDYSYHGITVASVKKKKIILFLLFNFYYLSRKGKPE